MIVDCVIMTSAVTVATCLNPNILFAEISDNKVYVYTSMFFCHFYKGKQLL